MQRDEIRLAEGPIVKNSRRQNLDLDPDLTPELCLFWGPQVHPRRAPEARKQATLSENGS